MERVHLPVFLLPEFLDSSLEAFFSISRLFHSILSIRQIDGKSSFINAFILSKKDLQ